MKLCIFFVFFYAKFDQNRTGGISVSLSGHNIKHHFVRPIILRVEVTQSINLVV